MTIYKPYTYLIGWSKQDIWYYGAEYGEVSKIANPFNLWKTYFTSSKYVKECREKYGEPDIVEVRKTFITRFHTKDWESKVIRRIKAVDSIKWLNKNDGGKNFDITEQSEESNEKRRKKVLGIPKNKKSPDSYVKKGKENNMYGKKHSLDWKKNHSSKMAGSGNPMYGVHRVWVNNGITSKLCLPENIPNGYIRGRI